MQIQAKYMYEAAPSSLRAGRVSFPASCLFHTDHLLLLQGMLVDKRPCGLTGATTLRRRTP